MPAGQDPRPGSTTEAAPVPDRTVGFAYAVREDVSACALPFDHHGVVPVRYSYRTHGSADLPPIVVLGGISASRHLLPTPADPSPGWWPGMAGEGLPLDPTTHRLVTLDYVGGPGTEGPPRAITTADQARAVLAVMDALDLHRPVVVGASYGGMVGLALSALSPDRIGHLVVACAVHRPHPMAIALRAIQRSIVRVASAGGDAREGVVLARALGMTTYLGPIELDRRFDFRPYSFEEGRARFEIEAYLEARGDSFAQRFDGDRFECLSESVDLHDVAPESVAAPITLISVDSDAIAPPWLVDEFVSRTPARVRDVRLVSPYAHDAFLREIDAFGDAMRTAIRSTDQPHP